MCICVLIELAVGGFDLSLSGFWYIHFALFLLLFFFWKFYVVYLFFPELFCEIHALFVQFVGDPPVEVPFFKSSVRSVKHLPYHVECVCGGWVCMGVCFIYTLSMNLCTHGISFLQNCLMGLLVVYSWKCLCKVGWFLKFGSSEYGYGLMVFNSWKLG